MNCLVCKGACCELPITPSDKQNIVVRLLERRWIALHDTSDGSCRELSAQGRCEIYGDRPFICRAYPAGGPDCLVAVAKQRTPEQYARIRDINDPPTLPLVII